MIGILLEKKYLITKLLGKKKYFTTYLAINKDENNPIKDCIVKHFSIKKGDKEKFEKIKEQIGTLSDLDHPFIPDFIEFFTNKSKKEINMYLVMEYINGNNLEELIKQGVSFREQKVLTMTIELLRPIEYLHKLSPPVIHRDITPSNIILDSDETPFLAYSGPIKDIMSNIGKGSSSVGDRYGYMATEHFKGDPVPASDIYSLGATLFYIVSKKSPEEIKNKSLN